MFKQKIIDKYAKSLDETKLKAAYENFKVYQAKAEAIKNFKEEEYQDGFLRDVFELCLGYTLKTTNPSEYNLSREHKNETDGKKADGAITIDSEVVALIELKDQNTKNLDNARKGELSPVDQCFRYLNSHQKAKYAIVSNFDELRLYVGKKTEYEKFNLFSLDFEGFKRLYLVMSFESIKGGLTARLKEETDSFEKQISKELYRDYSLFRSRLFDDIRTNNPHIEPHKLLRLTQTLCDRIIFILFAEDRELLRKNTIKEIRERYHNDIVGLSMYDYYKIYFKAINEGNDKLGIMPYNGGLFAENTELDSLKISDTCLDMQAQKLSDYDFESDISVNILGHIFEQSLTDLEELLASLGGEAVDKSKSKRKKDGVFYTPEYITRYIVANTLGKLCEQKRDELGISSQIEPPKNPKKLTKSETTQKAALQEYREWLKTLKICDPACGSGAFLNQALEYLISEHKATAQQIVYFGDLTATEDIEKSILEHNLYGVDINEEAVEIARLSLWLRTASRGRKLTNLTEKIKVGNSLISDKSVDERAFDWKAEFAEVFEQGGFDVIIGNPPYVRQEMLGAEAKSYFAKNYATYHGMADLYNYFYAHGFALLKSDGYLGYISSNSFFKAGNAKALRKFLTNETKINMVIDFGDDTVFEDATTYPTIFIAQKASTKPEYEINFINLQDRKYKSEEIESAPIEHLKQVDLYENGWKLEPKTVSGLRRKITHGYKTLKELYGSPLYGIKTGLNEAFVIDKGLKERLIKEDPKSIEIIKPFLAGRDLGRYKEPKITSYLLATGFDVDIPTKYPAVYDYLSQYKTALQKRTDKGREWYNLRACAYYDKFELPKIFYPDMSQGSKFSHDDSGSYFGNTVYFIPSGDWFLLALLNSKLMWFYLGGVCEALRGGEWRLRLFSASMDTIPIAQPDNEIKNLIADMARKLQNINAKLDDYNALLKDCEIKKDFENIIALKKEVERLSAEKSAIDVQIDAKVYEIYKLSSDEIATLGHING